MTQPIGSPDPTVLVAEDSPDTRDFLTALLNHEAYNVLTADNGADALEAMRLHKPHAVLLDLMMPILDGWKVLEERAKHPTLRQMPVICMSALKDVEQRVKEAGATAFLPKPLDCAQLLGILSTLPTPSVLCSAEPSVAPEIVTRIDTAVRQSELLYRTLTEQAWDGILLFDRNLKCIWANARAVELFGRELEELCQVTYRDLVDDDSVSGFLGNTPRVERLCRRPDASTFTAELSVKQVDARRTQVLVRDLTRAKQLEQELRQAQKMDAMGRLAGGIAHDFNNMLTVIIGMSELVIGQLGDSHEAAGDLREIHTAASKAAALTKQLLAFSRKQALELHPVEIDAHVTQFSRMLRRLLPANIELQCRLGAPSAIVYADATQLDQVLLNLAVNAKGAMLDGGVLTLSTEATNGNKSNPAVLIAVHDTGTGMSAETQSRIFEPFFTTKPIGEGTGLGLSMVYGIVTQLGGTIGVQSALGSGTTFHIAFPCVAADESSAATHH